MKNIKLFLIIFMMLTAFNNAAASAKGKQKHVNLIKSHIEKEHFNDAFKEYMKKKFDGEIIDSFLMKIIPIFTKQKAKFESNKYIRRFCSKLILDIIKCGFKYKKQISSEQLKQDLYGMVLQIKSISLEDLEFFFDKTNKSADINRTIDIFFIQGGIINAYASDDRCDTIEIDKNNFSSIVRDIKSKEQKNVQEKSNAMSASVAAEPMKKPYPAAPPAINANASAAALARVIPEVQKREEQRLAAQEKSDREVVPQSKPAPTAEPTQSQNAVQNEDQKVLLSYISEQRFNDAFKFYLQKKPAQKFPYIDCCFQKFNEFKGNKFFMRFFGKVLFDRIMDITYSDLNMEENLKAFRAALKLFTIVKSILEDDFKILNDRFNQIPLKHRQEALDCLIRSQKLTLYYLDDECSSKFKYIISHPIASESDPERNTFIAHIDNSRFNEAFKLYREKKSPAMIAHGFKICSDLLNQLIDNRQFKRLYAKLIVDYIKQIANEQPTLPEQFELPLIKLFKIKSILQEDIQYFLNEAPAAAWQIIEQLIREPIYLDIYLSDDACTIIKPQLRLDYMVQLPTDPDKKTAQEKTATASASAAAEPAKESAVPAVSPHVQSILSHIDNGRYNDAFQVYIKEKFSDEGLIDIVNRCKKLFLAHRKTLESNQFFKRLCSKLFIDSIKHASKDNSLQQTIEGVYTNLLALKCVIIEDLEYFLDAKNKTEALNEKIKDFLDNGNVIDIYSSDDQCSITNQIKVLQIPATTLLMSNALNATQEKSTPSNVSSAAKPPVNKRANAAPQKTPAPVVDARASAAAPEVSESEIKRREEQSRAAKEKAQSEKEAQQKASELARAEQENREREEAEKRKQAKKEKKKPVQTSVLKTPNSAVEAADPAPIVLSPEAQLKAAEKALKSQQRKKRRELLQKCVARLDQKQNEIDKKHKALLLQNFSQWKTFALHAKAKEQRKQKEELDRKKVLLASILKRREAKQLSDTFAQWKDYAAQQKRKAQENQQGEEEEVATPAAAQDQKIRSEQMALVPQQAIPHNYYQQVISAPQQIAPFDREFLAHLGQGHYFTTPAPILIRNDDGTLTQTPYYFPQGKIFTMDDYHRYVPLILAPPHAKLLQ